VNETDITFSVDSPSNISVDHAVKFHIVFGASLEINEK